MVLEWIPRDQNEEADELSNMDFGRFKEENRVTVDLEAAPFKRLKEMMDRAGKFYEDLEHRRQGTRRRREARRPNRRRRPGEKGRGSRRGSLGRTGVAAGSRTCCPRGKGRKRSAGVATRKGYTSG